MRWRPSCLTWCAVSCASSPSRIWSSTIHGQLRCNALRRCATARMPTDMTLPTRQSRRRRERRCVGLRAAPVRSGRHVACEPLARPHLARQPNERVCSPAVPASRSDCPKPRTARLSDRQHRTAEREIRQFWRDVASPIGTFATTGATTRWTFWDACSVTPWPHRGATRAVDRAACRRARGRRRWSGGPISACADDSAFGGTSLPLIYAGRAVVQSERVSGIMPL